MATKSSSARAKVRKAWANFPELRTSEIAAEADSRKTLGKERSAPAFRILLGQKHWRNLVRAAARTPIGPDQVHLHQRQAFGAGASQRRAGEGAGRAGSRQGGMLADP